MMSLASLMNWGSLGYWLEIYDSLGYTPIASGASTL